MYHHFRQHGVFHSEAHLPASRVSDYERVLEAVEEMRASDAAASLVASEQLSIAKTRGYENRGDELAREASAKMAARLTGMDSSEIERLLHADSSANDVGHDESSNAKRSQLGEASPNESNDADMLREHAVVHAHLPQCHVNHGCFGACENAAKEALETCLRWIRDDTSDGKRQCASSMEIGKTACHAPDDRKDCLEPLIAGFHALITDDTPVHNNNE